MKINRHYRDLVKFWQTDIRPQLVWLVRLLILLGLVIIFLPLMHLVTWIAPYLSIVVIGLIIWQSRRHKHSWIWSVGWGFVGGVAVLLMGVIFSRHLVYENIMLRHYFPASQPMGTIISLPDELQLLRGQTITLPVSISQIGQPINLASVVIEYQPNQIQIEKIIYDNSDFSLAAYSYLDQEKGRLRVVVGEPNPGLNQESLEAFSILAKWSDQPNYAPPTTVGLKIDKSSVVLANDGLGTNLRYQADQHYQYPMLAGSDIGIQSSSLPSANLSQDLTFPASQPDPFQSTVLTQLVRFLPADFAYQLIEFNQRIIRQYNRFIPDSAI